MQLRHDEIRQKYGKDILWFKNKTKQKQNMKTYVKT